MIFSNKERVGNSFFRREDGYYRCYYVGTDNYLFPAVSLTKLAETVGFPKKGTEIHTADKQTENKRRENRKRYTRVGMERLEDLDKLISMRQEEIREQFLFFRIMGNILFYLGNEPAEVLEYMDERNKRLYESISENCLLRIFTFCKEDYEKYLENSDLGIKYTNKKIVELLQIRPYEQQEMKQNGMSNNEIAKSKHIDLRKVDRLIGKNENKQKEKDLLRQWVMDMTADGKSASKISRDLGISVSTVRRIRAEMR